MVIQASIKVRTTLRCRYNLYSSARGACSKSGPNTSGSANLESENVSSPKQIEDSQAYCIRQVKKYDRENYLAALCINNLKVRRAIFALRAFNVELSQVRDLTTNSDRAKLRFLFWSKLIEEIVRRNKEVDSNVDKLVAYYNYTPVARELLVNFYLIDLDKKIQSYLNDLIGARLSSKVLGYQQFETMSELELYCSKSNASIYQLGWNMALQLTNVWSLDENISNILTRVSERQGVAHGISNIIRGIPHNGRKNVCYVPKDLLKKYNLKHSDFTASTVNYVKIAPAVEAMATRCQTLLNQAYGEYTFLPNFLKQILLPRVAIQVNLRRLRKCRYNVYDPSLGAQPGLLPLNMWLASKYFRVPIFAR